MDALSKLAGDLTVTFAAGRRNVKFGYRRIGVRRGQNGMAVMTVRANCRLHIAVRECLSVDAFLVSQERAVSYTFLGHKRRIVMASAASLRYVCPVNRGSRIVGGTDGRHVTVDRVTVHAVGGRLAADSYLGVDAGIHRRVSVLVKFLSGEIRQASARPVAAGTIEFWSSRFRRGYGGVCSGS